MTNSPNASRQIRRRSPAEPTRFRLPIWAAIVLMLLAGQESEAGTGRQRAMAAVAVARAALELADEQPILPDKNRTTSSLLSNAHSDLHQVIAGSKPESTAGEALSTSFRPMRLEFATAALLSEPLPAQLVIGGWETGCSVCVRLEQDTKRVLEPLGWTIGSGVTDQIRFVHLPRTEAVPQITLYQNGIVLQRWNEYVDPGSLSRELRTAWDGAPPLPQASAATPACGSAGTIHAQSQIRQALVWWRNNLGEGAKGSLIWDRSGAPTFPLLAKGDWSATALFGTTGHMDISAKGALRLPIDSVGFGYQIRGRDIVVDTDPIALVGFADRLSPVPKGVTAGTRPIGFVDPLTAWNIFSMFQGIYELLYPTCDLQLPEQISATATLVDKTLSVEFQQGPSIKLVALFTFHLKVQRVEMTESYVKIVFSGSRLVKERTFTVK